MHRGGAPAALQGGRAWERGDCSGIKGVLVKPEELLQGKRKATFVTPLTNDSNVQMPGNEANVSFKPIRGKLISNHQPCIPAKAVFSSRNSLCS